MRIVANYSHLNGIEFLMVHKPALWREIKRVVGGVDAEACKTKISKELRTKDKLLYSPIAMNKAMNAGFGARGWTQRRTAYWVTSDAKLIRKTLFMSADQQKAEIEGAGKNAIPSYNQTDFVKDRIAGRGTVRQICLRRVRPVRQASRILCR